MVTEPRDPHEGKYVIYLRVSTAKQGATGNGLDAQREACFAHLNGGDWKVVGEYVEVESGRRTKRPQLNAALEHCAKTGATLLVAKLDRLSRNVGFVDKLLKSGVKFECADMPHANNLTIHIIAAMAQYEAEQTSKRTKDALAAVNARLAKQGSYVRPSDGKVITKLGRPDAAESVALARRKRTDNAQAYAEQVFPVIERIRSLGITSLRGIADELTDRKIETPARQAKIDADKMVFGDPKWHPQQVKGILDRVEGDD